jgi:hypothetical protein
MSKPIVDHVREKSNTRNSARTLLLDLALYANDCCGVAWPADATLYHDVNVSRQRIHELKHAVARTGELVLVARSGFTNLHFVAWQGIPLGGTSKADGQHDPRCPLRNPQIAAVCARRWPGRFLSADGGEGSDQPETSTPPGVSDPPEPQGSEISEGRDQRSLTRKPEKTREKTPPRRRRPFALSLPTGADAPPEGETRIWHNEADMQEVRIMVAKFLGRAERRGASHGETISRTQAGDRGGVGGI